MLDGAIKLQDKQFQLASLLVNNSTAYMSDTFLAFRSLP